MKSAVIVVIACTALGLWHLALDSAPLILSLDGSWDYAPGEATPQESSWRRIHLPGDIPAEDRKSFTGWSQYRKQFESPESCLSGGCSLVIGEVGDAVEVWMNGSRLTTRGALPPFPEYAKNFPLEAEISPALFNRGEANTLILKVYAFRHHQAGPRKGPLGLSNSTDARKFERTKLFCSVFLPLACASGFLLLIAMGFIGWREPGRDVNLYRSFIIYCLTTALFMASFSEVPRQYLPVDIATPLHFVLRYASDWALVWLVVRFFRLGGRPSKPLNLIYAASLALFVSTLAQCIISYSRSLRTPWGLEATYYLVDFAFPLMLIGPILGAWASWRSEGRNKKAISTAFLIAAALYLHDYLVCVNVFQGEYISKFLQFLIGAGFAIAMESRRVAERARKELKEQTSIDLGRIAHDIRSPLAAVRIVAQVANLAEEERSLLRDAGDRISGICDGLLTAYRHQKRMPNSAVSQSVFEKVEAASCLILEVVQAVVTEARRRHSDFPACQIDMDYEDDSYSLTCPVDRTALATVIANLLNNAVEALEKSGRVSVVVSRERSHARIRVKDNGQGMDCATLARLGQESFTVGKIAGSGLGVSGAKQFAKRCGGRLSYESEPGKGTCVTLEIPSSASPAWLLAEIQLKESDSVVILDDDKSIHHLWAKKLQQSNASICGFSRPQELRDLLAHGTPKSPVYLIDHELRGFNETGLELIRTLGIGSHSILVTGHANSVEIQSLCTQMGLRLLPKNLLAHVPLRAPAAA